MTTGDRILTLRKELGLTQGDVAKACGVSTTTVHKWEHGVIDSMRADKIQRLADVLHTTIKYLLDGHGPAKVDTTTPLSLQESMAGRKHPLTVLGYANAENADEIMEVNPDEKNPYRRVITEGQLRQEEQELVKIYRQLDLRYRIDLLHYAFDLEKAQNDKNHGWPPSD